jgi:hypothetical protein
MNKIYVIKRFGSGNLLVGINYGTIRVISQKQYDYFIELNK